VKLGVVWFKRDLRVFDHAPLAAAVKHREVLPLYVYEPELIRAPDCSVQHVQFLNECLTDLDQALSARGSPLVVQFGEITHVLKRVLETFGPFSLYSHEETGNAISYARDKRVVDWCRANSVEWLEFPSNGVVRRLTSRDDWAGIWMERMRQPSLAAPDFIGKPKTELLPAGLLRPSSLGMQGADKPLRQQGGRKIASQQVRQFFSKHLHEYRYAMSSPLSAEDACSRLSPYLAYGVLSIRELMHKVWKTRREFNAMPEPVRPKDALAGLKSFESRLHWHCHFIQKLESEPEIEARNVHRGFDGLREPHFNREHFERWCAGETGFPLIDACMKMLAQTGWINFRMRALLVSFSSYQLWNHWREPALHLAREFLDYEPGIHYPQIQMQSGVTGINTLRIYNPVKQAQDQDPDGIFVKRWIPALENVPVEYIFEPWTLPEGVQQSTGVLIGEHYPTPIVDHLDAARHARDTLWGMRRDPNVRAEAKQVFNKHGSRNPLREGRPRKTAAAKKAAASADLLSEVIAATEAQTADTGSDHVKQTAPSTKPSAAPKSAPDTTPATSPESAQDAPPPQLSLGFD
jgi:deoxyribodipyrimidine photo-lyase